MEQARAPMLAPQPGGGSYRLCYVRGPDGVIVELAERIG